MNTKEALDALTNLSKLAHTPSDFNLAKHVAELTRTIRTTLEAIQREDAAWEAVKSVAHPMQPEMVLMLSLNRGGSRTPRGFMALDPQQSYAIVDSRELFVEAVAVVASLQADSQRLHREYNALVKAQRAGAENAADVIRLTDECTAKGIVLVPGGEGST